MSTMPYEVPNGLVEVTSLDVTLTGASYCAASGAWFGKPIIHEPIPIPESKRVPDELLVWECEYCGRRHYEAKPPKTCEGNCGGSRYKPLRLRVEDG